MLIRCAYSIPDFILASLIMKYVSRTPFLVPGKNISNSALSIDAIPCDADLIIIEADLLRHEMTKQIQSKLRDKPFLILTETPELLALPGVRNMVVLPKNISYSDFVEGLNFLADNH